jgi:Dolichyl-phosphate-mannose-protein mannosyltransferase
VAVALACLLFSLAMLKPQTLRAYDQPLYLGIASDLAQTGVYTNGRFGAEGKPGAYTAPLYPALVAGLAALDPVLANNAACVRKAPQDLIAECPTSLGVLLPVQVALAVLTLVLVWRSTLAIGGSPAAAWCALLAAGLGTSEYAVYARTAMTEALSLPLAAVAGLLLVLLVRRPQWRLALGLGVTLGLLTLARPEYLYLAAALGVVGAALFAASRRLGTMLVAAALVCGVVLAPWSIRNERLFGTTAPTYGYAGFILAQRMAYEAMTPTEWVAQWLYALPGFGPAAAHIAFPSAVGRLGWEDRPDTFYMVGNTVMVQDLAKHAPNPANQVGYLLRRYALPEPLRFLAVTLVLAWKALWVRKYFSLVTVPFFAVLVWRAFRRRDRVRLAFVLPSLFVLALHAATTVDTPRYSLMMIPCYAAAFGLFAGPWAERLIARWRP